MNIIIIHGDYTTKSYERLQKFVKEAKRRDWSIKKIGDKSKDISEALSSQELFAKKRFLIIEDYDLIRKKDIEYINKQKNKLDLTLIIYKNKNLSKTKINKIKKVDKVEVFELPKLIWSFLDSIYPGNTRKVITLFHKIIINDPPEFIFAMIGRHFRDLYWSTLKDSEKEFQSWRYQKLRNQAKKLGKDRLKNIVSGLAEIDIKVKTGKAKLKNELDFLIITELE
jgi:DNA polymerase III delta subunit